MNITLPRQLSQRLGGALALVLLLTLGLVAGLSALQTRQLNAGLARLGDHTLPALQRVHALAGVVDELRGLAALHLLNGSEPGPAALEARMQALRRQAETLVAGCKLQRADADEQAHCQAVQASLAAFLAAQERLLAASRRAAADPLEAAQARALLGGESQQAYQQLSTDIAAWWAYQQAQADKASHRAQQQAQSASTGLAGVAALATLLAAWVATAVLGLKPPARAAAAARNAAELAPPAGAARSTSALLAGLRQAGSTRGPGPQAHVAAKPAQPGAPSGSGRQGRAVPADESSHSA